MNQSGTVASSLRAVFGLLLLAATAFGCYSLVHWWQHRHLVEATLPKVLAEMRRQRGELEQAIEEYKQVYGFYPPAGTSPGQPPGCVNPLFYELVGTRRNEERHSFYDPTQKEPIRAEDVQKNFGIQCFTNSLPYPAWPKDFLSPHQLPKKELIPGGEVYGVGLNDTVIPDRILDDFHITPWRYHFGPGAHNPGKFDLWVEMDVAGKHYLIGNWAAAE